MLYFWKAGRKPLWNCFRILCVRQPRTTAFHAPPELILSSFANYSVHNLYLLHVTLGKHLNVWTMVLTHHLLLLVWGLSLPHLPDCGVGLWETACSCGSTARHRTPEEKGPRETTGVGGRGQGARKCEAPSAAFSSHSQAAAGFRGAWGSATCLKAFKVSPPVYSSILFPIARLTS